MIPLLCQNDGNIMYISKTNNKEYHLVNIDEFLSLSFFEVHLELGPKLTYQLTSSGLGKPPKDHCVYVGEKVREGWESKKEKNYGGSVPCLKVLNFYCELLTWGFKDEVYWVSGHTTWVEFSMKGSILSQKDIETPKESLISPE